MPIIDDIKQAESQLGIYVTKHHIVLYALLAVAGLFGVYAVESRIAAVAEAKAEAAQTALAVAKDEAAKREAIYQAAQAQREKENAQYLATIQQLQTQAKVQIIHDKALPAPELGHRIESITGFKQGSITLNPNEDLIVPLPLAQDIVGRLDQGLADAQTVVQQANLIKNQTSTITEQTQIIQQDKVVLAQQIDTDTKVLNAEKAKNRKSKLRWFGAGVIVGFIGRTITAR